MAALPRCFLGSFSGDPALVGIPAHHHKKTYKPTGPELVLSIYAIDPPPPPALDKTQFNPPTHPPAHTYPLSNKILTKCVPWKPQRCSNDDLYTLLFSIITLRCIQSLHLGSTIPRYGPKKYLFCICRAALCSQNKGQLPQRLCHVLMVAPILLLFEL